jgi:hypothetical protein
MNQTQGNTSVEDIISPFEKEVILFIGDSNCWLGSECTLGWVNFIKKGSSRLHVAEQRLTALNLAINMPLRTTEYRKCGFLFTKDTNLYIAATIRLIRSTCFLQFCARPVRYEQW